MGIGVVDTMAQIVEAIRANLGLVLFVTGGPALTVVNKEILDTGFREPVIVSGFGMFATMLFTRVLAASGRLHIPKREPYFWFRSCLPVGASAMATMAFGNAACAFRQAFSRLRVALYQFSCRALWPNLSPPV